MNSAIVVIIGPSTAGKSLIPDAFKRRGYSVRVFDTDVELAKRLVKQPESAEKPHIFEAYMEAVDSGNLETLVGTELGRLENEMLTELCAQKGPLLVITGPSIPIRDGWEAFCDAHQDAKFIYLQRDPEIIAKALQSRDGRYGNDHGISARPGFMSWNNKLTAQPKLNGTSYELVPLIKAVRNVANVYRKQFEAYEAAPNVKTFTVNRLDRKEQEEDLQPAVNEVAQAFGLV